MWNGENGKFKCYASLRIRGPGLIPDALTQKLRLEPTQTSAKLGVGSWVISTKDSLDNLLPLETHIEELLRIIERKAELIKDLQKSATVDVFCFFASESDLGEFAIQPKILLALGQLGLALGVDQYFCCD